MKTFIPIRFKNIIPAVLLAFLVMPGLQTARADQTNTQGQLSERDYKFDKAYIKYMISDHKADDADLKNWAAQTLPTLQEHLRMAENAKAEIDSGKPQISEQ
jgi:hypothetical protein